MKKSEVVKGITVELKLLITEDNLEKIKKLKNPNKSKVFRTYSNLLFDCLKSLTIPKQIKTDEKFTSLEDIERFNKD